MQDDDEIIDRYEEEFEGKDSGRRRGPGRGFLLILVATLLGGILIVIEIFANLPLVGSIGHAQSDLRAARSIALDVESQAGTFDDADARGLASLDPSRRYVGSDVASAGVGEISVFADGTVWAAAVEVRPGACFYVLEQVGRQTRYGGGTTCTGRAATSADQDSW
jgi:hypothetical protein